MITTKWKLSHYPGGATSYSPFSLTWLMTNDFQVEFFSFNYQKQRKLSVRKKVINQVRLNGLYIGVFTPQVSRKESERSSDRNNRPRKLAYFIGFVFSVHDFFYVTCSNQIFIVNHSFANWDINLTKTEIIENLF